MHQRRPDGAAEPQRSPAADGDVVASPSGRPPAAGPAFGLPPRLGACDWPGACGPQGVLIVGHGTADPVGEHETRQVATLVAGLLPDVPVELGFLEVIGPSAGEAVVRLAARGCRSIVVAPLLLFSAGHATRDVPAAVLGPAAEAGLRVRQTQPLGVHPAVVAASRHRRAEAVAGLEPVPVAETVLLVVGRGSSDPTALEQLDAFARATEPEVGRIELGFVAAARPTLPEAIAVATVGASRVIVQPHLLFRGHVEEQVSAAVAAARRTHSGLEWVQVGRLGPDRLVAEAVVDRVRAVWAEEPAG
ncbi:MAG: sirohydrochlorin chelatase [Planctomycetia bacterium]